eukprot:snap_masked-scaffold_24-processed-gene-1.21-mRNA-1 protein AED:0.11 eAED:0.11 QI:0/-1/0/1/-1/1/1/0/526
MFQIKRYEGREPLNQRFSVNKFFAQIRRRAENAELLEQRNLKQNVENNGVTLKRAFAQLTHEEFSGYETKKRKEDIFPDTTLKITSNLSQDQKEFDLKDFIIKNLQNKLGIASLFEIQRRALRAVFANTSQDVSISSPTGSGKTICYLIPMLNSLSTRIIPRVRGLVIVPTSDLAIQVYNVLEKLNCSLLNVSIIKNVGSYIKSDIIISTPGLLVSNIREADLTGFTLEHLEWLVFDEVDKLIVDKYHDITNTIFDAIYKHQFGVQPSTHSRQYTIRYPPGSSVEQIWKSRSSFTRQLRKIICSATVTRNPEKLKKLRLVNPIHVSTREVGDGRKKYLIPDTIKQFLLICDEEERPLFLVDYLSKHCNQKKVLIFANSVQVASRLQMLLQLYFEKDGKENIHSISSNITPMKRSKLLLRLKDAREWIVVSTDLTGRGLDIEGLEIVINYDLPLDLKSLVHRSGRTGRAGNKGDVISFVAEDLKLEYSEMLARAGVLATELELSRPTQAIQTNYSAALHLLKSRKKR